jgi:hypothetical protein
MSNTLFDFVEILWLFFLISGLGMMFELHKLAAVLVNRGTITNRQRWTFTLTASAILSVVALSILGAQASAGVRNPLCIGVVPGTERIATVFERWTDALLVLLVWWIWRGRSFGFVVHLAPIVLHGPNTIRTYTRRQVQLAMLGVMMTWLLAALVLDEPTPPKRCGPGSELHFRWKIEMPAWPPTQG